MGIGLLLTLAYVVLAALLLTLSVATRLPAALKITAIVVVSGFYVGAWFGHRALMGWATADPLPEQFRVHWITIDNPDKVTNDPGAIFFWVREIDEAGLPVGDPRAHRIGWNEEDAAAAEDALARMDEGELINGRLGRSMVNPDEAREDATDYAGNAGAPGSAGETPSFEFVRVPPPALPAKATPAASPPG